MLRTGCGSFGSSPTTTHASWLTPNEVAQDRLIPGFVTSSCPAGAKKVSYVPCICAVFAVGPRVFQKKRCSLGCFSEECILGIVGAVPCMLTLRHFFP